MATWCPRAPPATNVEGRKIDGNTLHLRVPRRQVVVQGDRLPRFLRQRGLSALGHDLTVCETIITAGMPVEVREYSRGGATLTVRGA